MWINNVLSLISEEEEHYLHLRAYLYDEWPTKNIEWEILTYYQSCSIGPSCCTAHWESEAEACSTMVEAGSAGCMGMLGGEPILPERGCDIILMCCAVILVAVLLIHAYSKGAPPQYRIDIICLLMKEYLASWLFEDPLWTCLELCIQNGMGDNKYVQNRYICAMQGQVGFSPKKGLIS